MFHYLTLTNVSFYKRNLIVMPSVWRGKHFIVLIKSVFQPFVSWILDLGAVLIVSFEGKICRLVLLRAVVYSFCGSDRKGRKRGFGARDRENILLVPFRTPTT